MSEREFSATSRCWTSDAAAVRELIYAVQLGCVLDLVFKEDATFRALPPKAVGRVLVEQLHVVGRDHLVALAGEE